MKILKKPLLFMAMTAMLGFTSCSDDDDDVTDDIVEMDSAMLYATTHSGSVVQYNLDDGTSYTVNTSSTDAEGIFYDEDDNSLIVASRDPKQIQFYGNVDMWDGSMSTVSADFMSANDLMSPRDVAVNGDLIVVADNADVDGDDTTADGRFYIYSKEDNGFTLRNTVTVDFKVWGIEFVGNTLYAIVDTTNMLASFDNFLSNNTDGMVSATKTVMVEGIVRTHGLDYDGGTMVLSDIGDAGSDADGGLHVITDFDSKFNNTMDAGTLALSDQMRISGAATLLGNPVNVAYDADSDMIYVAELANGGGRVLAFDDVSNASGNATPAVNNMLSGVSAVYFED
ncbi:hypothetical protein [Christiangramia portivictoriae]|uniref:hypothetical protein n=1 Tax=Christiangramia portivictoriae TaxID=326069 RepID=UPI000427A360|nr:hypothetical protein [Christiangramia portivictoriae]